MATIKGKWKFNEAIDLTGHSIILSQFDCNFESNGEQYLGFWFQSLVMGYVTQESWIDASEQGGDTSTMICPMKEEYRLIDFGQNEQEIDDKLYNFIVANAIPLTLEGKWRFNTTLTKWSGEDCVYVNFYSEGSKCSFKYMYPYSDRYDGLFFGDGYDVWYAPDAYNVQLGQATAGWHTEAHRIIDFGTEGQNISPEFYIWITENAKQTIQKLYTECYISDIADEIHKNGINDTFKVSEMPAMINSVVNTKYNAGKDAGKVEGAQLQKDAFWEGFQMSTGSLRTNYAHAFASAKYGDMLPPKYDITPTGSNNYAGTNADHMFYGNRDDLAPLTAVTIDFSQSKNNNYLFGGCYTPEIPFEVSMVSDNKSTGVFSYLVNCETIKKIVVNENNTFTSWFVDSKKLKNVTFEGTIANNIDFSACKSLTGRSITNIVEHLSDNVTGKTLTLSQAAVDNATFGNPDTLYFTTNGAYNNYLESEPIHLTAGQTIRVTSDWEDGHRMEDDATDWWFDSAGTTVTGGTPGWPNDWTYTAEADEDVIVWWYFASISGEPISDIPITIRIALVDERGNEITGENLNVLNSVTDATASLQIESKTLTWQELKAKKPNWSYGLIQ